VALPELKSRSKPTLKTRVNDMLFCNKVHGRRMSCAQIIFDQISIEKIVPAVSVACMTAILQKNIPYDTSPRQLPGISPLSPDDWLWVDDAYDGQMARRRSLIDQNHERVVACDPLAMPAAIELLSVAIDYAVTHLGFSKTGEGVVCPDGATVAMDQSDPMKTLGRIFQNDFCIIEKHGDEHVLTAAILCFPASWMLSEKFMRPMIGIHDTVHEYDDNIAKRVQRLFDGLQVDRPLWRFNALRYVDPELHQPRSIHDRRPRDDREQGGYFRSERQTLLRLPQSQAVVFGIHTFVVALEV
jgi:hypothetical protein